MNNYFFFKKCVLDIEMYKFQAIFLDWQYMEFFTFHVFSTPLNPILCSEADI